MKYLFVFALAILGFSNVATAQEDAISKYFDQYVDDERFTVVYISSKLFGMFESMDIDMDDQEMKAISDVVSDLKGLRILISEENSMNFYKEAKQKINTKGYEVLMNVRHEKSEEVEFLIKDDGDTVEELLLMVGAEDSFVLMSFVGEINLDKVGKMIETFENEGDIDIDNRKDK